MALLLCHEAECQGWLPALKSVLYLKGPSENASMLTGMHDLEKIKAFEWLGNHSSLSTSLKVKLTLSSVRYCIALYTIPTTVGLENLLELTSYHTQSSKIWPKFCLFKKCLLSTSHAWDFLQNWVCDDESHQCGPYVHAAHSQMGKAGMCKH